MEVTTALMRKYGLSIMSFDAGLCHKFYRFGNMDPQRLSKDNLLPSWCCDWTFRSSYTIGSDRQAGHLDFSASGDWKSQANVYIETTSNTLSTTAIFVGSITFTHSLPCSIWEEKSISLTSQIFSELEGIASASKKQSLASSTIDLKDAFFCTPIAYQRRKSQLAGSGFLQVRKELAEAYQALRDLTTRSWSEKCAERLRPFVQELNRRATGKSLFICASHRLGLGPGNARRGLYYAFSRARTFLMSSGYLAIAIII